MIVVVFNDNDIGWSIYGGNIEYKKTLKRQVMSQIQAKDTEWEKVSFQNGLEIIFN